MLNLRWNEPFPDEIPITPATDPSWATLIPGRRPNFKTHGSLGQAKNAMQYRVNTYGYCERAGLYELIDGAWVLRYSMDRDTDRVEAKLTIQHMKPYEKAAAEERARAEAGREAIIAMCREAIAAGEMVTFTDKATGELREGDPAALITLLGGAA